MENLTLKQTHELARKLLLQADNATKEKEVVTNVAAPYESYTYDMFLQSRSAKPAEMNRFSNWVKEAKEDGIYAFESTRTHRQDTEITLFRETGEKLKMLNFSSYNYLGLGYHPAVIQAAKEALDQYGLGAASSPVISGTFSIHKQLELELLDFFGMEGYGVSLFTSGYGVNLGTISAFIKPGGHIVLDKAAHMCLLEGAELSKGHISYFKHNDPEDLEQVLKNIQKGHQRILVGIEGVYSADGDKGKIKDLLKVAKKYGAYVLVDEAHSILLAGDTGRGVSEEADVLEQVDFIVLTFSKAFGGIGGAVIAKKELTQYINWYAKCRMFSCALAPGVTGGMIKALQIARTEIGHQRRLKIKENAAYFRTLIQNHVDIGASESWIVPVHFKDDKLTLRVNDYLQRKGLDASIMQFPAAPKNEPRIRLFITSEHTKEQLDQAAVIIIETAKHFNFHH
jgi:glycine C-acetyltransferase